MSTKRTQEEILKRIDEIKDEDFFGFQSEDLLAFLTYENVKPWLKEGVKEDEWKQLTDPVDRIKDYIPFAWEKANNCRGLSAGRSIEHMKAWVWLDGNADLLKQLEQDYQYYGKPHLVKVCEVYGIDWKALDNNYWVNAEYENGITADEALA